jgi:methyl-accepting chemotaxis protein
LPTCRRQRKTRLTNIRTIDGTIEEVSSIPTIIASSLEEQSAATSEIARNVQQTSQAARRVTINTGVNRAAGETGAAAMEVLTAAGDLSLQPGPLAAEARDFVAGIPPHGAFQQTPDVP